MRGTAFGKLNIRIVRAPPASVVVFLSTRSNRRDPGQIEQLKSPIWQPHEEHAPTWLNRKMLAVRDMNLSTVRHVNLKRFRLVDIFAEGLFANHTLMPMLFRRMPPTDGNDKRSFVRNALISLISSAVKLLARTFLFPIL
jgi:hypothetical protein